MDIDKEDLDKQIGHHQDMLRIKHRNLRERELQGAKHGLEVPTIISNHIHELKEDIRYHEVEIARLATLAAVGAEPLVEVEYRGLLAEVWDTPRARPTVAGTARLELTRLRLGIAVERANEIEHEVRAALAEEAFHTSELSLSFAAYSAIDWPGMLKKILPTVGRAIRFDMPTALQMTLAIVPPAEGRKLKFAGFTRFLVANNVWHQDEYDLFKRFLVDLEAALSDREQAELAASSSIEPPSGST